MNSFISMVMDTFFFIKKKEYIIPYTDPIDNMIDSIV